VIPRWIHALLAGERCTINGDGETSRDFCYIDNVVQANLLAATTDNAEAVNTVYNVAVGDRTTLNELYHLIRDNIAREHPEVAAREPDYRDFREGDVRHSQASIERARSRLRYEPAVDISAGLKKTVDWFLLNQNTQQNRKSPAEAAPVTSNNPESDSP
jgi:UDP-N-acetylglucosamine 4-epimerase